jgi:hypothetical protein
MDTNAIADLEQRRRRLRRHADDAVALTAAQLDNDHIRHLRRLGGVSMIKPVFTEI